MIAVVGLGSNLGDRETTLTTALDRLRKHGSPQGFRASHLYESRPWGPVSQPDFLNAVCLFDTPLEAASLLAILREIEVLQGRTPSVRWGPRLLDLDLLDLGGQIVVGKNLTLPHPCISERAFVLVPLCEVAPGWRDPLTGRTAAEMLALLDPDPAEVRLAGSIRTEEDLIVGGRAGPRLSDD